MFDRALRLGVTVVLVTNTLSLEKVKDKIIAYLN